MLSTTYLLLFACVETEIMRSTVVVRLNLITFEIQLKGQRHLIVIFVV